MDETTIKIGLLMEGAEAHQRMAEASMARLETHTRDLDGVVRQEIARALSAELQAVNVESQRAALALREVKRAANTGVLIWSVGISILCALIPGGFAWWLLPSQSEIAVLRAQRADLLTIVQHLQSLGGRVDLRHCGEENRLCVRVDRRAPAYGAKADYFIVKED